MLKTDVRMQNKDQRRRQEAFEELKQKIAIVEMWLQNVRKAAVDEKAVS